MIFCLLIEVLIEDHIVISLRNEGFQTEVLGHKADQLGTRSIVREFVRLSFLVREHSIKQGFAPTTSLDLGVNIKI